jgi:hypothetical protein
LINVFIVDGKSILVKKHTAKQNEVSELNRVKFKERGLKNDKKNFEKKQNNSHSETQIKLKENLNAPKNILKPKNEKKNEKN